MLRRTVFALVLAAAVAVPSLAEAQKLVFLVRHAERADDGAQKQDDPSLSPAGEARAARLRDLLEQAGISAIYVTKYRRTRDTAAPLAGKLKVTPKVVQSTADVEALVAGLRASHADDNVLIVGHTNTIPAILKALSGTTIEIAESDYGNLIVVVPATRAVSKLRF